MNSVEVFKNQKNKNNLPASLLEVTGFANRCSFEHQPGSQGHRQSNGKAEAATKRAKYLLCKAKEIECDISLAVLAHRNNHTAVMGTGPVQRLLG